MKTFQPGSIITIPGLYLLVGEPPDEIVSLRGQNDITFIQRPDHSRADERHRHFEVGDVLPDLGYANQKWVLFQEA